MKYFAYLEPDTTKALSLVEILDEYWVYWSAAMLRVGKSPQITQRNCIEDFCTVHWAWEISEDCWRTLKKI